MRTSRKLLTLLGLLLAFAVVAASCGNDDDDDAAPETTSVRICQAPSFTGMPAHVAVSRGFLEEEGVTGSFIACESGPANAAALIGGEVEIVGNVPNNVFGIREADFDVVMFQQVVDTHFFDIVVRSDIEVDCERGDWECTMQALDGMNVGVVARGAAAEQIAVALYRAAGVNPDDATYIATGLAGTTLAALTSNEIDWAITFEPGISTAIVEGIGYSPFALRAGEAPDTLDWPSLVNTTSREFYEANPNTVAAYARAALKAMDYMRDPANREDVLLAMNELFGAEGAIADQILDDNVGSLSITGELEPDRLTKGAEFVFNEGTVSEVEDFADYTVSTGG